MSQFTMRASTLQIVFGVILVAVGGIFAVSTPTLQTAFWIILIAAGGIVATHGWNARSEEAQKSGMVKSVAAELLFNSSAINNPTFVETDENKLSKLVIFPRMRITALEGAISSGLFLNEKDRLYLTRATDLLDILVGFNHRLSLTELQMANRQRDIKLFRTGLRDGVVRAQVISKLIKFGQLLMSEYGVKESDRFFVTLEEDATLPRNPKGGPDA